jgi:hypothetical protein
MEIILEYKLQTSEGWKSVRLSPDQYFDLEPGEQPKVDSVARYNHGIDYLNFVPQDIRMTRLRIKDDMRQSTLTICETFWNNGQNRVIERRDHGAGEYWEMIVEIRISEVPTTWEILRLGRREGILIPWYHGRIRRNSDGSETETKVDIPRF